MKRIARLLVCLIAAGLLSAPVLAQQNREPGGPRAPTIPRKPPAEVRSDLLDSLFARLRKVDSPVEAQVVERAIWELWMKSDSPTAELLLTQAVKALGAGEEQASLAILDRLVEIHPDFAEAWNKRATVYFMLGRYGDSLADIKHVLDLEPRHFGALSGLGMIKQQQGDNNAALAAFRDALAVNPQLQGAKQAVEELAADEEDI
ncbi:MAG: tetratricopeptide repeat protein [Rhizobiales bacterium]|nr:tetratricopeptide repeat protein [Hyphomicrobiales bacterium]